MDTLTFGAAFLAGFLTFLNPCVLPVLPIIFGSSASSHRWGPLAIAAGLALSFTAIGMFVATLGFSLGIDAALFRTLSSVMLIAFGLLLVFPNAQYRLQRAMGPISDWANRRADAHSANDNRRHALYGQFGLGVLLGAMWSPCVGPTLGAASLLAAQGEQLASVAVAMLLFGFGAALPLLILGTVLRRRMNQYRARLTSTGQLGRLILGLAMAMTGSLVLSGLDKRLETLFLDHTPLWFSTLGTQL
jgi:cytochrome c-type biogenesis protein